MKNDRKKKFPEGFLGVYDSANKFVCVDCIDDDEDVDDEGKFTPVFNTDGWFKGEICVRCKKLVEVESA